MTNIFRGVGLVLGIAAGLAGCKREPEPIAAVPSAPAPAVAVDTGQLSGTVIETMDAGGYTYAQLERGNARVWVAGPTTKLSVGMVLARLDGTAMPKFHSAALDRTFDLIYFVNSYGDAATAGDDSISGVVAETMSSGGYTYARLDHAGTPVWVAGPETKLAVGTQLGAMTGSLMTGFHSDSLKRTFDRIYFVNAYPSASAKPAPAAPREKVAAASGGKTIADVIAGKDALAGTSVVVRGRVIKLNDGIMDRNWIHLSDGGTGDLLVTTHDTTKLGDIVVARGVVATHQDFGAGYKYDVMIENATLASE